MKSDQLRRFLALSAYEQAFLLKAGVLLVVIAALIRLLGLDATIKLLQSGLSGLELPDSVLRKQIDQARRAAKLIRIAALRLPVNTACLRQSLLLWWMLGRWRLPAVLRLGVNRNEEFRAHAWVEIAGVVVNDSDAVTRQFFVLHERTWNRRATDRRCPTG